MMLENNELVEVREMSFHGVSVKVLQKDPGSYYDHTFIEIDRNSPHCHDVMTYIYNAFFEKFRNKAVLVFDEGARFSDIIVQDVTTFQGNLMTFRDDSTIYTPKTYWPNTDEAIKWLSQLIENAPSLEELESAEVKRNFCAALRNDIAARKIVDRLAAAGIKELELQGIYLNPLQKERLVQVMVIAQLEAETGYRRR